ncbi:MAG: type II toxin-antitoxin system HicB family antitoxin [Gammaproteobacteria bacterium]
MTMMQYKGYIGKVEYDSEARLLHGEVVNVRDVITFQARAVDELEQAFHDSVDDYVAFCKERGESPDKPYSGKFVLRTSPELHRRACAAAALAGKSLNTWAAEVLDEASASASDGCVELLIHEASVARPSIEHTTARGKVAARKAARTKTARRRKSKT